MTTRIACSLMLISLLVGCSGRGARGIADKRSDFTKFLPMTGDAAHYGLKPVNPYFRRANRPQILRAIENACRDPRKRGSSVYNPGINAGYYVNCNPENRQLLNGWIPLNPREGAHSGDD